MYICIHGYVLVEIKKNLFTLSLMENCMINIYEFFFLFLLIKFLGCLTITVKITLLK